MRLNFLISTRRMKNAQTCNLPALHILFEINSKNKVDFEHEHNSNAWRSVSNVLII